MNCRPYPIEFAETFTHEVVTIVSVARPAPVRFRRTEK